MSAIELQNINKSFGDVNVISDLSLSIKDKEFIVFVGPSGCGKSTMLRMIAGLETLTGGHILVDGDVVNNHPPADRGVAMVFQNYALYPHMTVAENMGFGLRIAGIKKAEARQRVEDVARTLHLDQLLDRYPKQLSGGQRQRVAIGRAIARRPRVFLFDEPLSNLDAALRVQMRIELANLHAKLQTTMIYVTHDQTEAMTLGDRIVIFNQGNIEQVGPPLELYQAPHNLFVAEFLGAPKINILDYVWNEEQHAVNIKGENGVEVVEVAPADAERLRKGVKLCVRPEHAQLVSENEGLKAQVNLIENLGKCHTTLSDRKLKAQVDFIETLGDCSVLYLKLSKSGAPLTLKVPLENTPRNSDTVHIRIASHNMLAYGKDNILIA